MPTIYRYKGYRFFFFSNEGQPLESPHVHVRHGERVAKFWLVPEPALASSWQMSAVELIELLKIISSNRDTFERAWHDYFG